MSKIRFFKASFASYVVLMYTEFEGFFTYKDIRRGKFTMRKATGSLKSHVNEIAVYDQPVCDDKEPQFKKETDNRVLSMQRTNDSGRISESGQQHNNQ